MYSPKELCGITRKWEVMKLRYLMTNLLILKNYFKMLWKEETGEIFKIETDVFDYETSSVWIQWIWREDVYCNGGIFPVLTIIGNSLITQDLEWYEALEDSELKDKALRNKAIMEGLVSDDDQAMIVGEDGKSIQVIIIRSIDVEEFNGYEKDEYNDLTITSEEACRAYQEIFWMMDEGWMDIGKQDNIDANYNHIIGPKSKNHGNHRSDIGLGQDVPVGKDILHGYILGQI
ncbi:hypothetical protein Tco_0819383 [Tanacetum coccineum]|uniref:Uncharacterized protein n=1 Tax=Tanacetum coccineum TaxID=301880 RepID=A0ABQ5AAR7_9ASTR